MILVTGATGYTGAFLIPRLAAWNESLRCLVRPTSDPAALSPWPVELCTGDLDDPASLIPAMQGVRLVFHLAHIRYTPALLAAAPPGVERLVLVSSQRRYSRVPSPSVDEVIAGEQAAFASDQPWTLLRPSMIYGPGEDRNLSRLAGYLHRRPWIPVCGPGHGLQQPLHVEDLVEALMAAARSPAALHRAYDLAGPEPLAYNALIDAVAAAIGVRPRKVHLPLPLVLAGLRVARMVGLGAGLETEQFRRLQEDKSCCLDAARADLGFSPRSLAAGLAQIHGGPRP
ncbi:MAG: NAD-dependent epimerase/dehydratase family protein [Candidatus Latescibacteria bacterium]|nr:NAD-dependent epimerase/dehydratase family protein [Candidatus Latescibacterota bacterium]